MAKGGTYKVNIIIKNIWIAVIAIVSLSLIWFLFGATSFFSRGIDLVETANLVFIGVPAFIFVALSILLLQKNWVPANIILQMILVLIITIPSIMLSITLFRNTTTKGWLVENVTSDSIQITTDGNYEYRLDLINMFQRNSRARLYVKDTSTDVEVTIPVDVSIKEIGAVNVPNNTHSEETRQWLAWTKMTPTDKKNIYILTTTERLNKNKIEKFSVDLAAGSSQKTE